MNDPEVYAVLDGGIVTNIIWLCASNAGDFPGAVSVGDRPVAIGDQYLDGVFIRDGVPVPTFEELTAAAEAEEEPAE